MTAFGPTMRLLQHSFQCVAHERKHKHSQNAADNYNMRSHVSARQSPASGRQTAKLCAATSAPTKRKHFAEQHAMRFVANANDVDDDDDAFDLHENRIKVFLACFLRLCLRSAFCFCQRFPAHCKLRTTPKLQRGIFALTHRSRTQYSSSSVFQIIRVMMCLRGNSFNVRTSGFASAAFVISPNKVCRRRRA